MDNFVPEEDIVTVTNFEVIIPSITGQFEEHCEIYSSEFQDEPNDVSNLPSDPKSKSN